MPDLGYTFVGKSGTISRTLMQESRFSATDTLFLPTPFSPLGTHRPRLSEELMIPVSAPDRQSQDRPGGLLGAEVQPAELEDECKRRFARLIAVVDVIPVASVLDRDVCRGRGLVALAGVNLEQAAGQFSPVHGSSPGVRRRLDQAAFQVLARHLDAVGQVEEDLGRGPRRDPQVGGRRTRIQERIGREKGTSLNSTCLTPKPLASSVYVHVPEAPSPHERSISVMSLFPSRPAHRSPLIVQLL